MLLSKILGLNIRFSRESQSVDRSTFSERMVENARPILAALRLPENARSAFLGRELPEWSGILSEEMAEYYYRAYQTLYPGEPRSSQEMRLSRYLGRSLARYQFLVTGTTGWSKFLTLAFSSTPFGRTGRRLFYRSMPERFTRCHRAPWIGKGYVKIDGRKATPALAGWNGDGLNFVPGSWVVSSDDGSVRVSADYVVVS